MSVFFFPLLSGEFYVLASQMQLDDLQNWNGIFRKYLTSTLTNFQMIFNGGNRCCCKSARFFVHFFFVRSVSSTIFGNGNGFAELTPDSVPTKKKYSFIFPLHWIASALSSHCGYVVSFMVRTIFCVNGIFSGRVLEHTTSKLWHWALSFLYSIYPIYNCIIALLVWLLPKISITFLNYVSVRAFVVFLLCVASNACIHIHTKLFESVIFCSHIMYCNHQHSTSIAANGVKYV